MTQLEQILFNVVGGILASFIFFALLELCKWFKRRWLKRCFKQVFGKDALCSFNIVYGKMLLLPCFNEEGQLLKFPYIKPNTNHVFRMSSPVSFAETKSAKYIGESFSKNVGIAPKLVSDDDIRDKLDISYCSLGGFNDYKTIDVLESEQNTFYKLGDEKIIDKEDDNKKYEIMDDIHDYAVITKVVPKSFPDRVWIAIAGLGEWGTSGASWYLSRNWKKIRKIAKNKPFGLIIKVQIGKDESAEIVDYKIKE